MMEGVTAKLVEWLKEFFNKAWIIEIEDKYIEAKYEDAYDMESIWISIDVNEYGVESYNVVTECAKRDDEILICDSCHDAFCEECTIFERFGNSETGEVDSVKLDEYFKKEVEKHLNQPHYELHGFNGTIRVEPTIVERKCYLDIPHYHYYRGVKLIAELYNFDDLKALITLRDFFYSLIKTF